MQVIFSKVTEIKVGLIKEKVKSDGFKRLMTIKAAGQTHVIWLEGSDEMSDLIIKVEDHRLADRERNIY